MVVVGGDLGEMVTFIYPKYLMIMTPNDVFPNVVCHGNGNNTGQLRTLRGMGSLGCVGRKTYFQKSGSLMLVPFLLIEIIKKPKNN